jgi:hypothetical protein
MAQGWAFSADVATIRADQTAVLAAEWFTRPVQNPKRDGET